MQNIGDAVLTFLGDTSQLDQVFARVPAQAEASMGAAAASVGQVGVATGELNFELDATASNVPYCGEVIKDAMGTAEDSTRHAAGEAGLLGELFGIHLPRHVRSFLAELPGVSTALNAAFAATAVVFLIEALFKGIEKLQEMAEEPHKIALAWDEFNTAVNNSFNSMNDKLIEAGKNLDDVRGDHLAALRKEIELIDHASLHDLASQFDIVAKAADAMFAQVTRSWLDFDAGSKGAQNALNDFKVKYDLLISEGKSKEAADLLAGTLKSAQDTLAVMQNQTLQASKTDAAVALVKGNALGASVAFAESVGHGEKELKAQEALIDALKAQEALTVKINQLKNLKVEAKVETEANREAKVEYETSKKYDDLIAASHAQRDKEITQQDTDLSKQVSARLSAQLKDEESLHANELKILRDKEIAAIAEIDGEMRASEQKYTQQALLLKGQYDRGLISGQQYLAALRTLNDREVADLKQALERKEQLVILEAQNEAARRGQILTTNEAKELKAYTEVEAKKAQIQDEYNNKFLKVEDQVTAKQAKNFQTIDKLLDDYVKKLRSGENELKGFAKTADATLNDVSNAFGSAIEQWVSGQKSFGAALKDALQSYLAQVAGKAAIDALYFAAWGIADTFWNPPRAGADFAAAAEFAAIAAVAGGAAAGMGKQGGASSGASSSSSSASASTASAASTQPAQQPTNVQNVPKLFGGGIVTQPTLAMIGDNSSGGSSREAVIPLDSNSLAEVAKAFGASGGSGDTHHNYYIQGMISTTDLAKFSRMVTRGAQTGRLRMTVANSNRVTRRS